jgi:hypothetical protein
LCFAPKLLNKGVVCYKSHMLSTLFLQTCSMLISREKRIIILKSKQVSRVGRINYIFCIIIDTAQIPTHPAYLIHYQSQLILEDFFFQNRLVWRL